MMEEKIPYHVKVYVEGELRIYRMLLAKLDQLKKDQEDIYQRHSQPKGEPVKGSHPGDPTATAALLLERNSEKIEEIEKRIKRIESGLWACADRQRELIEIKYFSAAEPSDEEVMDYMRIGNRNNYYKIKFGGLAKIARKMQIF